MISGILYVGVGDKLNETASRALPAGSFITVPKGLTHYLWTKEETIVQLNSARKWNVKYFNKTDEPSKKIS